MRLKLAAIGALLILLAMYLFPFGQDFVMLWLTSVSGSQEAAWINLYYICFALLVAGFVLGGAKYLGIGRLAGIFRMLLTNPLGLAALMVIMLLVFMQVAPMMGG